MNLGKIFLRVVTLLILSFGISSCTESISAPTAGPEGAGASFDSEEFSMGGGALGGSAVTTLLAQDFLTELDIADELAWVAHEVQLGSDDSIEHTHEFAFVYALRESHVLVESSADLQLQPAEGAAMPSGVLHRHEALDAPSTFWEIRLARPGSPPPENMPDPRLIFESLPLQGLPNRPLAAFVHVLVPPGGRTSVHTHPGPELIYQLSGRIEYENALIGARAMGPGEIEGIPPEVAVQKRNISGEDAEFVSWFVVDSAAPFASPARFSAPGFEGENLALLSNGARVVGVSSNFGEGSNESRFGANNALDGDPSTEWSSNGDGDSAWIEIELSSEAHVSGLGFWTRTMGDSAQVFSFRVITDREEVYGPYDLTDADITEYFDVDLTAKRLRFEAVNTSGGNTGAIEIEVIGAPSK